MLLHGNWRLNQTPPGAAGPTAQVALIQGSLDTVFEDSAERRLETLDHYRALTDEAVKQRPNLDLVVWPESMFVVPETIVDEPASSGSQAASSENDLVARQNVFRMILAGEAKRANSNTDGAHAGTMLLVNTLTVAVGSDSSRYYNTALWADREGNVAGRYYKTHPVMFGEYVPFAEAFPWLNKVTPISIGLSRGDGPRVFDVAGLKMSPSVCFESSIPHLIRSQVAELARRGTPADVLVNVTNDGWFWGTAMLDHHFRCGVFRAVENRKPLLVVANTGISMHVDGSGVVRQRGPRRQPKVLLAEVQADGRWSPYQTVGDWPAWMCAAACAGLAIVGVRKRRVAS